MEITNSKFWVRIYVIQSTKLDWIYIDFTTKLNKRFNSHRQDVRHNVTSTGLTEHCNFDEEIKIHIQKKISSISLTNVSTNRKFQHEDTPRHVNHVSVAFHLHWLRFIRFVLKKADLYKYLFFFKYIFLYFYVNFK